VISYTGGASTGTKWVAGMLDDYAFLTHACLDGWLATGSAKYYRAALDLAERMVAEFYDTVRGRVFRRHGQGRRAAGRIDGTAQAAAGFADAGGKPGRGRCAAAPGGAERTADLREKAEDTLEAFAGVVTTSGSTREPMAWPSSACCCRRCRWW
jgi:uncharacterized protein YyaL (SSP411 family)